MGIHIFLVIGFLNNPDISDGQLKGGVRIGQNGNPFIGMDGRAIVQIRTDALPDVISASLSLGAWTLTPVGSSGALARFFPKEHRPSPNYKQIGFPQ